MNTDFYFIFFFLLSTNVYRGKAKDFSIDHFVKKVLIED